MCYFTANTTWLFVIGILVFGADKDVYKTIKRSLIINCPDIIENHEM